MRLAIIGRDGKFYGPDELHLYGGARGGSMAPNVIRDDLPDLMNHADGKRYSSKRAFERAVRAAGCEIVGNEKLERRETPMDPVGPDIKRAIAELRSR